MQTSLKGFRSEAEQARQSIPARAGAIGKGIIAYLLTGSLGVAVLVFVLFWAVGC